MFLDNLSLSLLEVLDRNHYSYQKLSNICDVSPEFIGKIIRCEATPTINVLEKISKPLSLSPNQLLRIDDSIELTYRSPMQISNTKSLYPICPRCNSILPRHNQAFCDTCGQKLKWNY